MPQPSRSTAGAVFLDKQRRIEELRDAARRAAARLPSIQRAVLFGSLAHGIPTPRSDADITCDVERVGILGRERLHGGQGVTPTQVASSA